jgi:8-oxo-dGTP pyrophosphatase MutT (NUDIX family)
MSDKPEVTARPASTVLLIRDGAEGLEVFMVVRNRAIDFAGGALVFPGGRVEPDDVAIAGGEGLDAFRIAGIRETFEECGVLLARPPGCPVMIGAETLLRAEDKHRAAMNRGERTLSELLAAEQLQPAAVLGPPAKALAVSGLMPPVAPKADLGAKGAKIVKKAEGAVPGAVSKEAQVRAAAAKKAGSRARKKGGGEAPTSLAQFAQKDSAASLAS